MRLISTETLTLEEFYEPDIPSYAILSHRWTKHETTFKDYCKGRDIGSPGRRKVLDFCAVARERGHAYAWVDTVCIDKPSSSELSEAINSMFRWYQMSAECLVHLADVDFSGLPHLCDRLGEEHLELLAQSDWFTRGWTLQELIAPRCVSFFTANWSIFGCKSKVRNSINGTRTINIGVGLAEQLSAITGIPEQLLTLQWSLEEYTIATRAKWLASRRVTRIEDQAYCALGLFGVNMSLLYGEGKRAWIRLQEEIVRTTYDESILAWPLGSGAQARPLFCPTPAAFASISSDITTVYGPRPLYTITNQGLRWDLQPGSALVSAINLGLHLRHDADIEPVYGDMKVLLLPLACLAEGRPTYQEFLLLIELSCGHYMRVPHHGNFKLPLPIADLVRRGQLMLPCRLEEEMTIFVHFRSSHSKGCDFAYNQLLLCRDLALLVASRFSLAIQVALQALYGDSRAEYMLSESGFSSALLGPGALASEEEILQHVLEVSSAAAAVRNAQTDQSSAKLENGARSHQMTSITRMIDCLQPGCHRKGNYGFNRRDKMRDHMRQIHGFHYESAMRTNERERAILASHLLDWDLLDR